MEQMKVVSERNAEMTAAMKAAGEENGKVTLEMKAIAEENAKMTKEMKIIAENSAKQAEENQKQSHIISMGFKMKKTVVSYRQAASNSELLYMIPGKRKRPSTIHNIVFAGIFYL